MTRAIDDKGLTALMTMRVKKEDLDMGSGLAQAMNDAFNMAWQEIRKNYIPIAWLEKEYLGEIRRAGCMPRGEVVKEIIERWEKENAE